MPEFDVRVGRWAELGTDARAIREAVFVQEQRIPIELEWDEADAHCLHAVAFDAGGRAIATGRLLEHVPGVAKIGRMAVLREARGLGAGRVVLDALMQGARGLGYQEALLHAQLSAKGFYLRAGFEARGAEFDEAGIRHVEMIKAL
ncbi:MAG: GNAT family N-acetyltransferase [Paucibacter sp.]|nr:GNAT family N-acetyltransferase [Roseateles sp.]